VHKKHLIAISEGTRIDGVKVVPDSVEPLDAQPDTKRTRLKIVVIVLSSIPHSIVFDVSFLNFCMWYNYVQYNICYVDCEYLIRSIT
jgi:hypothetical protein